LADATDNLNATNGAISEVSLWVKRLEAVETDAPVVVNDSHASDDGVDYTNEYPKLGDPDQPDLPDPASVN
jgi:hypothetical protein